MYMKGPGNLILRLGKILIKIIYSHREIIHMFY